MADATAPAGPGSPAAAAPERGFFQTITGMFFSPREEFAAILPRARFWLPLACWIVLGIAFTAVWTSKVDVREFMRNQIEQSGRADKIPPGQMEQVIDTQSKVFKPISWASSVLAAPIICFALGGIFLFVFRFFYSGNLTYGQSVTVTAWSYFTVALVSTPLLVLVMALKGDWNVNPQEAIQANASVLLDRQTTAKALYSLASSIDLFSFWIMWLLSAGYAAATRRPTTSALFGVASMWALFVLCKVALSAIF